MAVSLADGIATAKRQNPPVPDAVRADDVEARVAELLAARRPRPTPISSAKPWTAELGALVDAELDAAVARLASRNGVRRPFGPLTFSA